MVAPSLPSLCLVVASLVGQTLAVSQCDIRPQDCSGQRASWGYSASNGPVNNSFVSNLYLHLFSIQATWATNYPDFCAGDKQSPIDLDSSKAVTMDPGPITMVDHTTVFPSL